MWPCWNTSYFECLKIVKYVQHPVAAGGQRVHQRSHVTQVACFSVPATVLTVSFITFVVFPRHECSKRCATSFTLAYRFLFAVLCFVVSETRPASKMSVINFAGETNVGERAGRACHANATCLVTDTCYITPTAFFARPTDVHFAISLDTFVIT